MNDAIEWLKNRSGAVFALVALAILVHGCETAPEWLVDKAGHLLDRVVEDPQGVASAIGIVGGALALAATGLVAAWRRDPNASGADDSPRPTRTPPGPRAGFAELDALLFLLSIAGVVLAGLALQGCGASALQTGSVAVTVALRAEEAVDDVYQADLDRRQGECPPASAGSDAADVHNVCVEHERQATASIATALSALEVAIRSVGAGIATAAEIDAGAPIPVVVLDAVRRALALFDEVEVALRDAGVDVPPEVGMVVAALGALAGPAS